MKTRKYKTQKPDKVQADTIIKWLNIYCGHIYCDTLIDYLIYWGYDVDAQINEYGIIVGFKLK